MQYYKLIQILKNNKTEQVEERILCYAETESLDELKEEIEDYCYLYGIQISCEECSKYQYESYRDRVIVDYNFDNIDIQ